MASQEIQIFVRWITGTKTVDVLPSDTIAEVKLKLREKLDDPPPGIRLLFSGADLLDGNTVESYGIARESTLVGTPAVVFSLLDESVLEQLRNDLRDMAQILGEKEFVFIGLASYDNGHGSASIKRQQCPDSVLNWCRDNAWNLTVILVDPGFAEGQDGPPQIYDIPGQHWSSQPTMHMLGGKVRLYKNLRATFIDPAGADHMRCDMRVITYATAIPEYDRLRSLTDRKSIGGMPVIAAFKPRIGLLRDACVVSGNFYQDPPDRSQYCTLGSLAALAACGITWNP